MSRYVFMSILWILLIFNQCKTTCLYKESTGIVQAARPETPHPTHIWSLFRIQFQSDFLLMCLSVERPGCFKVWQTMTISTPDWCRCWDLFCSYWCQHCYLSSPWLVMFGPTNLIWALENRSVDSNLKEPELRLAALCFGSLCPHITNPSA